LLYLTKDDSNIFGGGKDFRNMKGNYGGCAKPGEGLGPHQKKNERSIRMLKPIFESELDKTKLDSVLKRLIFD